MCKHYCYIVVKLILRCNEGFEFAGTRPNNYETCGPNTGFQWSFDLNDISEGVDPTDSRINDCVGMCSHKSSQNKVKINKS